MTFTIPKEQEIKEEKVVPPPQLLNPIYESLPDEGEIPKDTNAAEAEMMHALVNPSNRNMVLTGGYVGTRYATVTSPYEPLEERLEQLAGIPNGFKKPIYAPYRVRRDTINFYDRRSPSKNGKAREQNTIILSSRGNPFGMGMGMGGPGSGFQHLRSSFIMPEAQNLPQVTLEEPKKKRFGRG